MIHQVPWYPNGEFEICCKIFSTYAFLYCVVFGARSLVGGSQSRLVIEDPYFAASASRIGSIATLWFFMPSLLLQFELYLMTINDVLMTTRIIL